MIDAYLTNPKSFMNLYRMTKRSKKPATILKNEKLVSFVDSLLSKYQVDISKISMCIFLEANPGYQIPTCKMCDSKVMFLNHRDGYSKWCSIACTRKDSSKVPIEKQKRTQQAMHAKVRELLDNPDSDYRAKISKASKEYNNRPEVRAYRSNLVKDKIKDGSWTPCVTNSWTKWKISVHGYKFRSSFEGIFYIKHALENSEHIEYESLRIPYINDKGLNKTYIVDFIDKVNKCVYEIKPKSLSETVNNSLKRDALLLWCKETGYKYFEIDEYIIFQYAKTLKNETEFVNDFRRKYRV